VPDGPPSSPEPGDSDYYSDDTDDDEPAVVPAVQLPLRPIQAHAARELPELGPGRRRRAHPLIQAAPAELEPASESDVDTDPASESEDSDDEYARGAEEIAKNIANR